MTQCLWLHGAQQCFDFILPLLRWECQGAVVCQAVSVSFLGYLLHIMWEVRDWSHLMREGPFTC